MYPRCPVLCSPQGPGIIANVTATISHQVKHIAAVIGSAVHGGERAEGSEEGVESHSSQLPRTWSLVEPTAAAEEAWVQLCADT